MPRNVIEHRASPLLGEYRRCEDLVKWSQRQKPGARWVKDFPYGLRFGFVAAGVAPRIYTHWNQFRFRSFLDGLSFRPDQLLITEFGTCVNYRQGRTRVTIPSLGEGKLLLWDSQLSFCQENSLADVNWMIGMFRLGEEGPSFYTQAETQAELQEATAVAQFRVAQKKVVPPPARQAVRPAAELDPQTRQFLLRDALTNILLQSKTAR